MSKAEYQDLEQLKISNPKVYDYCHTFIWTMHAYINACLIADTGLIKQNAASSTIGNAARFGTNRRMFILTDMSSKALKSTLKSTNLGLGAIPIIGDFASMIIEGASITFDEIKEAKRKNTIKIINDIIHEFIRPENIGEEINKAALEIIKSASKVKQIENPYIEEPALLTNVMNAVADKVTHLKDQVLKNKQIKSSWQEDLAVQDVLGVFASMYENYEQFKAKRYGDHLYEQISKVVIDNGLKSVIKSALEVGRVIIAQVEAKIEQSELKNIQAKAKVGMWQKTIFKPNMEVSEYLKDDYLKKWLGKNLLPAEIEAAKMVIFKHICTGIKKVSANARNYECAIKFAEAYPELIKSMAIQYPDFFVSREVAKILLERNETLRIFVVNKLSKFNKTNLPTITINPLVDKDDLAIIEAKLDADELKALREKVVKGLWAKTFKSLGKEVEEYLDKEYLQEYLGNNALHKEIDAARMVIFKHICKAINNVAKPLDGLMICPNEFAKNYPHLVETIAQNHPELFENKAIAAKINLVKDNTDLIANISKHFSTENKCLMKIDTLNGSLKPKYSING